MAKFYFKKTLVLITVIMMLFTQAAFAGEDDSQGSDIEYLKSVIEMIKDKYKGVINDEQLIEGALKGMFDTMDPYTTFYTPQEADSFMTDLSGNYEGIGVVLEKSDPYIMITKVLSDSPAEKAGIYQSDHIVMIDGKSVVGMSLEEAASLIRGLADTVVELGIKRDKSKEVLLFKITRSQIKQNPVVYYIWDNIGYIKLESFNKNAGQYIREALDEMDRNGITRIMLDLRDNPGGEVSQAVNVARNFVPEGLVTTLDFKSENTQDESFYSYLSTLKYKIAVLINSMTASASEIVAGAIQDTAVGVLVGQKTFGKAKVQNLIPMLTPTAQKKYEEQTGKKLVDGYDLMINYGIIPSDNEIIGWTKMTTGVYLTPNGRMIDEIGLHPDIKSDDPQLFMNIDIRSIHQLPKKVKAYLGYTGVDVLNAEKILGLLGYSVNEPDYILDEKTFEAVKKYQKDQGLYPYGVIDFTTQQKLNESLMTIMSQYDPQYKAAIDYLVN